MDGRTDGVAFGQKPQNLNLLFPTEQVGHGFAPLVCDESVTIQLSRLELGGNVWFQFGRRSLQRPPGFLFLSPRVDSIIVIQVSAVNLKYCNCFKRGENGKKTDAWRKAGRSWQEAGLPRGPHCHRDRERPRRTCGRLGRASGKTGLEPLGSRYRGNPGAACHQERRQGVTIPSVSTRTPPAGYKAAAPPRRGPFSVVSGGARYRGKFVRCNMAWLENLRDSCQRNTARVPILKDAIGFRGFA